MELHVAGEGPAASDHRLAVRIIVVNEQHVSGEEETQGSWVLKRRLVEQKGDNLTDGYHGDKGRDKSWHDPHQSACQNLESRPHVVSCGPDPTLAKLLEQEKARNHEKHLHCQIASPNESINWHGSTVDPFLHYSRGFPKRESIGNVIDTHPEHGHCPGGLHSKVGRRLSRHAAAEVDQRGG